LAQCVIAVLHGVILFDTISTTRCKARRISPDTGRALSCAAGVADPVGEGPEP
jgi:hypothetical protein